MQNRHYVCVPCRYDTHAGGTCPLCGRETLNFGLHFRPPRRNNLKQWKKIELVLATRGQHTASCFYAALPLGRWCYCSPGLAPIKVPADVKTKFGLRRSNRRHYAREESQFRGRRPPLAPWPRTR